MKSLVLRLCVLCFAVSAGAKPLNILFAFADDWGRYASAYVDVDGSGTVNDHIRTPAFDRIASEGVLFANAHVTAPSCTPCRSSLLSGQYFYRTGQAAILQGAVWNENIPTFPLLLQKAGYHIGFTWKVWSPGTPRDAGFGGSANAYARAGSGFNGFSQNAMRLIGEGKSTEQAKAELLKQVTGNFEQFLAKREGRQPFLYWFGPTNVHRKWIAGSGKKLWGLDPDKLKGKLPAFLPDVHVVREDFADYLGEAMAFDTGLALLIDKIEAMGELDNTVIVVSGDHGAPGFPRGKCNLYDFGTAVPLAVRWPGAPKPGRVVRDFINLMDLAPTFLEVGGVKVPGVMTGRSIAPLVQSEESGWVDPLRSWVITGRERHVAAAREGGLPYPQRAIRTKDHLYIHNFRPDRWPMGDPGPVANGEVPSHGALVNNTFVCFGDLDASPTKAWQIAHRNDPDQKKNYMLGYGKRPQEELYVMADDPDQMNNRADEEELSTVKAQLRQQLMAELRRTGDPRVTGDGMTFERPPFTGTWKRPSRKSKK